MLLGVSIILAAVCLFLALRLYTLERDVKSCTRQLEEKPDAPVHMAAPNREGEALLAAVNRLQQLRQGEAAEYRRQEHDLRRQIANVSHDLRTPLTSILGYLQLLEQEELKEEERREYLEIIRGRGKSLQTLITAFYDLSRLEGGEYPLEHRPVNLHGVMSRLVAEFYNEFTDSGFEIRIDLAEGLPPILADPGATLRVFSNLAGNALSHGCRLLDIKLFRGEHGLITSFTNGVEGLSQEDVPHLFERFYTADKMRTGQNTGLGLAIVKTLVEQMGHQVSARLEGDLFTVEICWQLKEKTPAAQ